MKRVALATLALLAFVPLLARASDATFAAASANPGSTFATAADFNTVTVALTDPGTPLRGIVALAASAGSSRGVSSVRFQSAPAGTTTWTDICTDTTAPYACDFDTAALPDGLRDLQVVATDAAGYSRTAIVSSRRIDNTAPTVSVTAPPAASHATMTLGATVGDGNGSGVVSVRYQFRATGASTWIDACTSSVAPFSCTADFTQLADGGFDERAIATDGAGLQTTSATVTGVVDNTAPSAAALTDPGTPLTRTVTLTTTASDARSGIASVRFERAPAGGSTWTPICTDTSSPYSCAFDTTALADGSYDLRVVATDVAGNAKTSATVAGRRIDNSGPSVTLTDPGATLRGAVTLNATASDPSGVTQVVFARRTAGGSTWTTICTDTSAPYSCSWSTTGVPDGSYDLQAVATDALGQTAASVVSARRTDNNATPAATDVQAVNGTGAPGTIDAGDVLTFTYSEPILPSSLVAGWNGTSRNVIVRVTDATTQDTLAVYDADDTTRIRLTAAATELALKADRTTGGAKFNATMTTSGANVAVTLGSPISGSSKSSTSTTKMVWTPSTQATDYSGNAVAATAATETGTDVDF